MPKLKSKHSPAVGDHVADQDGNERIVTDIRAGKLILRPLFGGYREIPAEPDQVTPWTPSPSASS